MSDNPFALQNIKPATQKPVEDNPFSLSAIQADQRMQTRAVLTDAVKVAPEQAAEAAKLEKSMGIPGDVVLRNLMDVQMQQAVIDADAKLGTNVPVLTQAMRESAMLARQAHKDIDNLSSIEQLIRDTGGSVKAGVYNASRGAAGVFRAGFELVAPVLDPLESITAIGGNPLRRLAEGFAMQAEAAGAIADAAAPKTSGVISGGFQSGIQSLTQNTLALPMAFFPGGQGAALSMMTSTTGGSAYQQAREKGLEMSQALPFAASQAAIEYATEKLPLDALIGGIKAGTPFMQTLVKQMALEIPGEQVATILQDLNEWAVLNPGKPFSEYLEERPNAAAQTLIATIVGTGGNVAIVKGIDAAARKLAGNAYEAGVADAEAKRLTDALQAAQQSQLRDLNPDQFRSLVQQMADQTEGAPTEIYVDGDVLNQLAPEALAQLPQAVRDQIPQAAAIGDVVAISMGDVLTVAPGTVLEQALVDNARIGDPRAMTRKEAQEAGAQAQEFLAQEAQRVMQQAQDQAAVEAEFAAVRDDLKTQIAATQRYSESVSDAYATGLTHFFVAYGSRTGMGTQGLYQAYRDRGFRISGQPTAQAQGQVLNDGALGQGGVFDLSVPEDGNQLRDVKVGDTTISLNARGRFSNPEGVVEVASVRTPQAKRGSGSARAALQALVQQADAQGVTLKLDASPLDRKTKGDKLVKFYESLGFQRTGRSNNAAGDPEMVRPPVDQAVLDQQAGGKPRLMAINNLSADNLLFADRMGGIAVPSIGVITDQAGGVEGFGEITLLGTKDLADPRSEPVFSADAYTVRFPKPEWPKAKSKDAQAIVNSVRAIAKEFDDRGLVDMTFEEMVNSPDAQKVIERWVSSQAAQAMFLREQGVDVKPAMRQKPTRSGFPVEVIEALRPVMEGLNVGMSANAILASPQVAALPQAYAEAMTAYYAERGVSPEDSAKIIDRSASSFGYAKIDRLLTDLSANLGEQDVDSWETRKQLEPLINERAVEFKQWVEGKILPKFGDPFLKVGGKKAPYTLANIVKAMTDTKVKGNEKTMTYGAGQVRAATSIKFSDIEQMREAAASSVVDVAEYEKAKKESEALLDAYRTSIVEFTKLRNWRGDPDTWEAMDASMRALAKWGTGKKRDATSLRAALRGEDFDVAKIPDEVIEQGIKAGNALLNAPVPYFEAKPQRAVQLNEFAGAVIPANASEQVREVLQRNGVPFVEYTDQEQRMQAARDFAGQLSAQGNQGVLFQGQQGPLGTFNPRSLELVLNPDANLSTLWHEMGHFFLEVMADISSQPNAPAQISADFDTFLKWAGTDRAQWAAWQAEYKQTGKINPDLVAIHERWAESIEQYIMEGKVPNAEMQPLMRRFSAWLLDVYKSIKKFLAGRGVGPDGNGTFQQAAFHGTPHRGIDKFSTDKIGTGEGAQAYGWGLYFASKKEIAEHYRKGLSYREMVKKFRDDMPDNADLDEALEWADSGEATPEMAAVIKALANDDWLGFDYPAQALTALFKDPDAYDASDALKAAAAAMQGQLYKVEIPEDSEMLLWDKPLSEQPKKVRETLAPFLARYEQDQRRTLSAFSAADVEREIAASRKTITGQGLYEQAGYMEGGDQRASEYLRSLGIKGIKYLDGTSRSAGDGSYNYVIFSGDDVQITEQFYQGGAQQAANMQLNDDIRRVMDRMLATDEQIQQANEAAGMAPNVEADAEANERLNKRSMADLKWTVKARDKAIKKLQAEAASIRKEIEEQVTLEVNQMPEVLAKEKLDALTIVPEHKVLLDQYKADRQAAIDAAQTEITDLMVAEQEAKEGTLKGLAKGQFLAKSKREIANRVDARMIEWDRANPRPMRPVNITDMDMAVIADSYGFADVPTMLQAIDAFGNKRDVIEGMTEQRMLEEHGDLIDPRAIEQAANEAVHNEARARSLASELRTQQEMLNPRTDTGQVNAAGSKITVNALVEAAKQFGANVVARTPLKDLRSLSAKHTAAERRAAKRWQEATAKGDTQAAVKAKQDQMLNNAAAKAAIDALEEAKKITEFFKRVVKGNNEKVVEKGRDPDIVNAARAVLAAYGVETPTTKAAADYLETLQRNDPQTYAAIEPMIAGMMQNAQPLQALTFQELQALGEEINAVWHLAKRSRQMEVDGDLLDVEDVADEVYARMEEIGIPDTVPGETGALTKAEERSRMLQFAGALLRRVEQWAEAKDGKFGGPFLRFIFQPVKDAADRYRADRVVYRKKFQALVDNIAPMMRPGLVEAPELGYTFGRGHNGIGMAELLHAILHTGNGSNKRKLLLGRGWATENADGTLDTSRWDAFIKRLTDTGVLTKAHYDFAQGVWDLMEETKPLAQKTHRDVFGRYFEEITAESFDTPFGTYRGGYVPAQADPLLVQDAELRDLLEGENESMSYSFPSTNKGFTKGRVEYNRPLKLDLRSLPQHLDKVLLFSHMEPAVRGVAKLIKQPKVSQPLGRIDPGAISGLLRPWLNRSARQVVETPVLGDGRISRMASIVRARAGMTLMFANLSNTIQQITGLSTAAVKVKPAHLMRAVANYIANPRKASRAVWDASPYMDDRASNEVAAMNDVIDQILLDPSMLERGQAWTQRHGYFLQTAFDNILSPIVWTGAYNQAIEEGMEERMAIRFADGVVRQTQGSTLPEDVSRFETGPAYARLFTQFVGYFNMMANTNATALKQITGEMGLRKGAGKALYVVTMGLLMPIWVAEAIAQAFRGGPEDEDDDGYLDDWMAAVFGFGTIKGIFAQVPIVGQVSQGVVSRFNDNPADDKFSLSPAVSLIESAAGSPASVYKAIVEDGPKQKAVRDVAALVTMATGIPVYAAARPVGYAAGVADDRIEPTGPVDLTRGLVTGTASPESKQR